jgi:hypothetical protein
MGSNFATEMADGTLSELGIELTMEQQIGYHLRGNLYPPVPLSMVAPCIEAINAYWADDWRREIELPEGISYRGKPSAPAWSIIESHRLEAWTEDSLDD